MKGIVVEVKNNKTVVLADDGEFIKLNQAYNVGETITIPSRTHVSHIRRNLIAVAAALMVCLGTGGIYAATATYSYVTLDINPSVEYHVNYFDHVTEAKALNNDGKTVVKALEKKNIKGDTVSEAIDVTVDVAKKEGLVSNSDNGYAIVSVVSKNDKHTTTLSKKLIGTIKADSNVKTTVDVVVGTIEDRETATKLNMSTGRLQVAKQITNSTNKEILNDSKKSEEVQKTGEKHVDKLLKSAQQKQKKDKKAAEKAKKAKKSNGSNAGSSSSSNDSKTDKNTTDNTNNTNTTNKDTTTSSDQTSSSDKNTTTNQNTETNGQEPGVIIAPKRHARRVHKKQDTQTQSTTQIETPSTTPEE